MHNRIISESIPSIQILTHAQLHQQPSAHNSDEGIAKNSSVSPNINDTNTINIRRNTYGFPRVNQLSHRSVLDNIQEVSESPTENFGSNHRVDRPFTVLEQHVSAPSRLNLSKILTDLDNSDPFQAFILNPAVGDKASNLFQAIACKDLPASIRKLELDWKNEQIRNMLGVLCKELLPEDKVRFNVICNSLKSIEVEHKTEILVGRELSFLLNKYGKQALYRQVETFTECCRKAWQYYSSGHLEHPSDDDIFTPDAEACYTIIYKLINELTKPKQEWVGIVCDSLYFKDTCSALGSSLKIDSKIELSAESVSDTFDNNFPREGNVFLYPSGCGDTENTSEFNNKNFQKNISSIFCCAIQ